MSDAEHGIELPPLISTDPIASAEMMQQLGIVNIYKPSLTIAAKTSVEKKLHEIFRLLQNSDRPNDEFVKLLFHAIDACKCKEESHTRVATRLFTLDRIVKKDTHLKE